MLLQDRVLLALASASGCICCWLAYQSLTQWTLEPTSSPSNLMFLLVVTGTIVTLLVSRRGHDAPDRSPVARRQLLLAGGAAAAVLLIASRFVDGFQNTGADTISVPPEASLAGFAGVGILIVLLRVMTKRLAQERADPV